MFTKVDIYVSIQQLSSTDDRAGITGEESPGFIGQGAG